LEKRRKERKPKDEKRGQKIVRNSEVLFITIESMNS
jgi:hypothetical protein